MMNTDILVEVLPGNSIATMSSNAPGNSLEMDVGILPGNSVAINCNNVSGNSLKNDVNVKVGNSFNNILIDIKEDQSYISGTVKKDSVTVSGAKVYLIDETTNELIGTVITDEVGNYRFDMLTIEHTYHVAVSWTDELDNKYNAKSKPFIVPTM